MVEGDAVVEARRLTKLFSGRPVLAGVDLTIEAGRIHGLLGPNGAGKTTLLSMLFGLMLPDGGELRLFGRTRAAAGDGWLDGVGGFVEAPRFYPYLTGRANLLTLAALDGRGAPALVDDLLDMVGLAAAAHQKVRHYSLGMRQRLGLAAALLRRPRLLVLDEPTNGMDPAGIRDLRDSLRNLASAGMAVALASHDMTQVEDLCDQVTVLDRGRVAFSGGMDHMRRVAPDPAWRLHTSDDDRVLALGWAADGLKITRSGARLQVTAGQPRMDEFVVMLGRQGIAVRELAVDVTPLEAFFFHLTEDLPAVAAP